MPAHSATAALCKACKEGNVAELKAALEAGAAPDAAVAGGETPLHCSIRSGSLECAQMLLDTKCDPDVSSAADASAGSSFGTLVSELRLTPLMQACIEGQERAVKFLLDAGAGAQVPKQHAQLVGNPITPLMLACRVGRPACVKLLLDYGQDTELAISGPPNCDGDQAIDWAL